MVKVPVLHLSFHQITSEASWPNSDKVPFRVASYLNNVPSELIQYTKELSCAPLVLVLHPETGKIGQNNGVSSPEDKAPGISFLKGSSMAGLLKWPCAFSITKVARAFASRNFVGSSAGHSILKHRLWCFSALLSDPFWVSLWVHISWECYCAVQWLHTSKVELDNWLKSCSASCFFFPLRLPDSSLQMICSLRMAPAFVIHDMDT